MTVTNTTDLTNQVQKVWGAFAVDEFRDMHLLPNLVNKPYEGQILREADTVYVSQITPATGENRTVGVDADSFGTEKMTTNRVAVQANKRAVAAYEFTDLAEIQSQLGSADSEVRTSLLHGVMAQINDYLYSLISPSTSAPDHVLDSVTDFNSAQFAICRKLAGAAKWPKSSPMNDWYALLDPSYYSDAMDDTTLSNADYGNVDRPVINGQIAQPRFGFNVYEDTTDGLTSEIANTGAGTDTEDAALLFHKDFMHCVMQTEPRFKISDKHPNNQFGYVISCDVIYGAVLATGGDERHIFVFNT